MIEFLLWLDGVLWGLPLIVLMVATGLYFTIRSGFFQFRHFGWIMKRTAGQMFGSSNEAKQGENGMLTAFEAISTAIGCGGRRAWRCALDVAYRLPGHDLKAGGGNPWMLLPPEK